MSNGERCGCPRCMCRGLMGPVVMITLGVLFLLPQMGLDYSFRHLWPVLLVVIGIVKIAEALASTEGHVGR